jgi:ArsR family transcriptional regulator, arsenate/arsenite/antimonite-responsive transcriptional repressor
MRHDDAAQCFSELGHSTRLSIYRLLVKSGSRGMSVGEIQTALKIPGSTLSHHISRLVKVRLITQKRLGRELFCQPLALRLEHLINYLQFKCSKVEAFV